MSANRKLGKTITFLLIIVLLSSIAGCITQAKQCPVVISKKEGIVISRFEPSYKKIPVGDEVTVYLDMQNMGIAKAEEIQARLWAYGGFRVINAEGETLGNELCVDPDTGDETEDCPPEVEGGDEIHDMYPPDMALCSSGDAKILKWQLKAGCDPTESILSVHANYEYMSEGWATVLLASHIEAEKVGGKLTQHGENFPSSGPLEVKIEPLQSEPVILTRTNPRFDARVSFSNLGSGLVGKEGVGGVHDVHFSLKGPCNFTDSHYYCCRYERIGGPEDLDEVCAGHATKDSCEDSTYSCSWDKSDNLCYAPGMWYWKGCPAKDKFGVYKHVNSDKCDRHSDCRLTYGSSCSVQDGPGGKQYCACSKDLKLIGDEVSGTYPLQLRGGKQEVLKILHLQHEDGLNMDESFVADYCKVNARAEYEYQLVDEIDFKMGVYGTAEEVRACYSGEI